MKRKYIHFLPHILNFAFEFFAYFELMHFNRLNHAVKEHTLNALVHCLTPSSPRRLMYACTM